MDQQLPLSEAGIPSTPSALGAGDQACNECKRRKGRCDRQLPECGPCARNKRHCLYERHSKTPLTRKHLTAVEERLRQAELRLRQSEYRVRVAEHKLQETLTSQAAHETETPIAQAVNESYQGYPLESSSSMPSREAVQPTTGFTSADWQFFALAEDPITAVDATPPDYQLEEPPSHAEDFSWDEQEPVASPESAQPLKAEDGDDPVTDGMASLSVEDRGTGYLGVASGAAMLRLLLPDAHYRKNINARAKPIKQEEPAARDLGWVPTPVYAERNIREIDLDAAIDLYFSCYHLSYPIVHEPTFRAQYAQVIPRPNGRSWNALAYMIGAVGLFTTAHGPISQDVDLFEAAKSNLSIASLETGNITLVQVLTLMSNYLQKRNKPNSGYNYLGLALHMAMGLGLHKEFQNWHIAPLSMEIRRRVWWSLYVFFSGAMITFGRPVSWPSHGVEVALPLNVDDRDLTHASSTLPAPKLGITTYSSVTSQARFHLATNDIYARVISMQSSTAAEMLQLDDQMIESWRSVWADEPFEIPIKFQLSRKVMEWRYRNFRIIMYRPFLIRHILRARSASPNQTVDQATRTAIDRCLFEAESTVTSIHEYWFSREQICMASWYCLYFLFQASLIPSIMLRNQPTSEHAANWRGQIRLVLRVTEAMRTINPASRECHMVIMQLCGDFLELPPGTPLTFDTLKPVEESPETQLGNVYTMMWPNAADIDMLLPSDDSWTNFLAEMPSESPLDPTTRSADNG
ncbi:Regulatory protein GAL4 [Pseudocercospora fuligena]|uniref:Regulatory protein GAL4 n=1 Tax=Pseudocercospora fuligena TaxID=685502 RepID=A0A8H6RB86_9PEZI|nr:Regulatory protein GAL4 [Pseudocercospora fuligena]